MYSPTPQEAEVFGRVLRAMREGAGLGLRETARRLKISANTLSLLERGKRNVSIDTLADIARVIADELTAKRGDVA